MADHMDRERASFIRAARLLGAALAVLSLAGLFARDRGSYSSDRPVYGPAQQALAASPGFLTYPFRWDPNMRLLAGWQYADGSFHGAIDYVKGASAYKNSWQHFDVLSAAPGEACWTYGGGNSPGPIVRIQHHVGEAEFETRYVHLQRVESNIPFCPDTVTVPRGFKIGVSGDTSWERCPPPCVHLHFEVRLKGKPIDPYDIYSVPYRYPQPNGKRAGLMGKGEHWLADPPTHPDEDQTPPVIHFSGPPRNAWYHTDEHLAWKIVDARGSGVRCYNVSWDRDPGGLPCHIQGDSGQVPLSQAGSGIHTLLIRAWDLAGNETMEALGWYGYDPTPPAPPSAAVEVHGVPNGEAQSVVSDPDFAWQGASDLGAGITGYQVYWGTNPSGMADNWTTDQRYNPGPVAPGTYYLRVRTIDGAGNTSPWATLFVFRYVPRK